MLPNKPKIKPATVNSPVADTERSSSLLSTLSEEDLIRKAAEMLAETSDVKKRNPVTSAPAPPPPTKKFKLELNLPPVPGLDDDEVI